VNGVLAALQPLDVEGATLEIDVEPAKAHYFGHAQAVAVHHQHEEPVAFGKGGAAGGVDEFADLVRGEVAAGFSRLSTPTADWGKKARAYATMAGNPPADVEENDQRELCPKCMPCCVVPQSTVGLLPLHPGPGEPTVMGTLRHILQSFVRPCMQSTALAALFGLSLASMPAAAAQAIPPVGQWLTEDRSGVIAISPCGGALCGRIVGMAEWPTNGTVPVDVRGRPECGLTIISDARLSSAGRWDGRITDPDTGRIYNAQLWVDQAGRLHLHGYIGLPLFGMTQVWTPYLAPVPQNCRLT